MGHELTPAARTMLEHLRARSPAATQDDGHGLEMVLHAPAAADKVHVGALTMVAYYHATGGDTPSTTATPCRSAGTPGSTYLPPLSSRTARCPGGEPSHSAWAWDTVLRVPTVPERLSFAEADARTDGVLSASFEGAYDTVLFFDGDLTVDGSFLPAVAAVRGAVPAHDRRWPPARPVGRAYRPAGIDLIVVTGDLTVAGDIELDDSRPGLYVGGTTRAETLVGGDAEIHIGGGAFTYLVHGHYNHGILETGTVAVPWVINSGHDLRVTAPGARRIDNHGDDVGSDFSRSTIAAAFVSEVVAPEDGAIVVSAFLDRLRAGLPVLRPDVTV